METDEERRVQEEKERVDRQLGVMLRAQAGPIEAVRRLRENAKVAEANVRGADSRRRRLVRRRARVETDEERRVREKKERVDRRMAVTLRAQAAAIGSVP